MLDFVRGSPGSVLLMKDMYRIREACMPPDKTVLLVVGTRMSKNHSGLPQEAAVMHSWWRGREFPHSLVVKSFSVDLAPALEEGRGWVLGYTLVRGWKWGG
jgi:hypothetical protein